MPRPLLSRYIRPQVLARVRHLPFVARQLVEGGLAGGHRSPAHGFAVEFADHREYVPGDDPKHIDWNVYYRRDRAFVKQYHQETNLVCHVIVDVSASMRYGEGEQSKLGYASHVAATLAYLVMGQGDRASLALVDDSVRQWVEPGAGAQQLMRITEALDTTPAVGKTSLAGPLIDLAPSLGRRGVVVILSDLLGDVDAVETAMQRLRFDRHDVVLLQVMHRDELAFDLRGIVRFMGLEDFGTVISRPVEVRKSYLAALQRHRDALAAAASRNRAELMLCPTDRPLEQMFADYLQQRIERRHQRLIR